MTPVVLTVPRANAEIVIWTHSANTLHYSKMAIDREIGEGGCRLGLGAERGQTMAFSSHG